MSVLARLGRRLGAIRAEAYKQAMTPLKARLDSKDLVVFFGDNFGPQLPLLAGLSHYNIGQRPYDMGFETAATPPCVAMMELMEFPVPRRGALGWRVARRSARPLRNCRPRSSSAAPCSAASKLTRNPGPVR